MKLSELAPAAAAKVAGLRYSMPDETCLRRITSGKTVRYVDSNGKAVRQPEVLERIKKLVVPPAWQDVLISPREDAHIQAQGRDAKGRKQYRYHTEYRAIRDQAKFDKLVAFGKVLPKIRRKVASDLRRRDMTRDKVIAVVVKLLETSCIRVGNVEYAEENESFGLTTMKNRHVTISGKLLRFKFRGKSGQEHDIALKDGQLAKIVRQCQCIPGYELFRYVDNDGHPQTVDSADVNDYIREVAGDAFTAKDFRTWHGTCLAAMTLAEKAPEETITAAKRTIVAAVKETAAKLGNRPATCRKYYIHPDVFEAYTDGTLHNLFSLCTNPVEARCIAEAEKVVMKLLSRRKGSKRSLRIAA